MNGTTQLHVQTRVRIVSAVYAPVVFLVLGRVIGVPLWMEYVMCENSQRPRKPASDNAGDV
jgi:hypothetical protein